MRSPRMAKSVENRNPNRPVSCTLRANAPCTQRRDRAKPGSSGLPARKAEPPESAERGIGEIQSRDRAKPGSSGLSARKAEPPESAERGIGEIQSRGAGRHAHLARR